MLQNTFKLILQLKTNLLILGKTISIILFRSYYLSRLKIESVTILFDEY